MMEFERAGVLKLIESPSVPKCEMHSVWERIIGVSDLLEPGVKLVPGVGVAL